MKLMCASAVISLAFWAGAGFLQAAGQTGKATGPATTATQAETTAAQRYFTDTVLLNQNGESVRFYSDLIKDRTVVINTFFTECVSVCPLLNRNMQAIQDWLGDRLNRDVLLLSISVDPANDTPARIKEYSQHFHAKPGWLFLTGKKENVEFVLQKLGQKVESRDDHSTVFIIGNDRTHLWKKAVGAAKTDQLIPVVESVVNDNPARERE
ncbi:MAG TPA: SCO family protein [Candidatus Angelobacter sp.]